MHLLCSDYFGSMFWNIYVNMVILNKIVNEKEDCSIIF